MDTFQITPQGNFHCGNCNTTYPAWLLDQMNDQDFYQHHQKQCNKTNA